LSILKGNNYQINNNSIEEVGSMLLKKTAYCANLAQDEDIMIFLLLFDELEVFFDRCLHDQNTEYSFIF